MLLYAGSRRHGSEKERTNLKQRAVQRSTAEEISTFVHRREAVTSLLFLSLTVEQ